MPTQMSSKKPHFVLVPFMAQGHTIPMVDMARSLASRGATVTFVTTPVNAARISTIIGRVEQDGLPVRFVPLRFPAVEAGLPEGVENIDMLPSPDLWKNFLNAICMLLEPLVLHLRDQHSPPNCIISDNIHYWTRDVAREFGIPRLVFHGFGCFALLCIHNVRTYKANEKVKDDHEPFLIPDLPHAVEVTTDQLLNFLRIEPHMADHLQKLRETELESDGVVINSFDDLEPSYSKVYQKTIEKKVWTIGPLSLSNRDEVKDMAVRGNKSSIDEELCLKWLDSRRPASVLYVSYGSLTRTGPPQLVEVGLGLEASGFPFIWVIKGAEKSSDFEGWLSAFEERTRERGLIIRGWAPQVLILSHPAVGGFMTHCGWNSTLESVSAGVPMITWPHFAEQFLNEKLIVEVLKIGVPIGVKVSVRWGAEDDDVLVKKAEVETAVRSLFDESDEAEERRRRAKEVGEKAHRAVGFGGSSDANLTQLIEYMECLGKSVSHGRR